MECVGFWVLLWLLIFATLGLWRLTEKWSRPKPPPVPELEPAPPTPPPPTVQDVATAARERYRRQIDLLEAAGLNSIELQAGRDRAKQKYLRELNGLME